MALQIQQFNLSTGAVTGGYASPYTVSFPVRDRSARNGLFLFTNEEDSHFMYTAPPWGTGPGEPYALYQYVDLLVGTPKALTGIEFPFTGNMTPPSATPLIFLQNYTTGTAWNGLFATDTAGNFYLRSGSNLYVYAPGGTHTSHAWALHGTLLQLLWSSTANLYTVERTLQGSGATGTFKDAIYKYTTTGSFVGNWYAQANFLPQPTVPNIPTVPGLLLDVSSTGNLYVVDTSNHTINGIQGSPYAAVFSTALPTGVTPVAMCLCEALGYLAVLCATNGSAVGTASLGVNNASPVWDASPPYSACQLYLYNMTTGALITPSWGTVLPFLIAACPEYTGILFDGVSSLLIVDKFNAYAEGGGSSPVLDHSITGLMDATGELHIVYEGADGHLYYQYALPTWQGALSAPVQIAAGDPAMAPGVNMGFLDALDRQDRGWYPYLTYQTTGGTQYLYLTDRVWGSSPPLPLPTVWRSKAANEIDTVPWAEHMLVSQSSGYLFWDVGDGAGPRKMFAMPAVALPAIVDAGWCPLILYLDAGGSVVRAYSENYGQSWVTL